MAERWKAWKTKIRFSTLPTAPWKSRKGGEIPTFPQFRRFVPRAKKTGDRKKCGLWKSGNPKAGFPLSHSPDSRRRKEEDCSNQSLKGTGRAAPTGIISCSSCIGNGSSFHAHPSIGKCSVELPFLGLLDCKPVSVPRRATAIPLTPGITTWF